MDRKMIPCGQERSWTFRSYALTFVYDKGFCSASSAKVSLFDITFEVWVHDSDVSLASSGWESQETDSFGKAYHNLSNSVFCKNGRGPSPYEKVSLFLDLDFGLNDIGNPDSNLALRKVCFLSNE